ncbi:MAG TPA: CPBP family intramembrane glutamic endopeptidase [Bacteroidia bacterium]
MQNYTEQNRLQYFADILILIGFFVLSISLFTYASSFIVSLISGIDFKTLTNAAYDFNQKSHVRAFYWINALSSIGGFFVSAWLFILFKRYYFKQAINIRRPISAIVWPLIPILFISIIIISSWLNQLNIKLAELPAFSGLISQGKTLGYLKSLLAHMNTGSELMVNMFFIALIPAVCEEVFFRGVFQKLAIEFFGNVHIGIVITSFIFALIHFNFIQILPMMFLAMVFG